ncbi:HAD family hydrolase [Nocardia callitridis]|uniref:HAD family hydrolase n=1 Tax=Nocardia callitridis TaxID=648753 RepID=A0ABP9K213_9NOCA
MTALAELLRGRRLVLLDFDGPICAVFSGIPDHAAAGELVDVIGTVPTEVATSTDPFDILRYVAESRPDIAEQVEQRFTEIETKAVGSARPTADASEFITEAARTPGMKVAVASNNSVQAIGAYLDAYGLRSYVSGIFARTSADPSILKPAPRLLLDPLDTFDCSPDDAIFVGDSTTDVQAGNAAGVRTIAFANRPEKTIRFAPFRPAATITRMAELRQALKQHV